MNLTELFDSMVYLYTAENNWRNFSEASASYFHWRVFLAFICLNGAIKSSLAIL